MATLQEIETHYSLCDILEANEALDIREEMLEEAARARGSK